jgi:dihydrolipoamide dehydrogenase
MEAELLIVGGGPAGYTAAIRGAQQGLDVALVEDGNIGGTCLNHGCIPSKAMLTATDTVHEMDTADEMGIYVEPYVDLGEMVDWKNRIVDQLTDGVSALCRQNGVELVNGTARFTDDSTVLVDQDTEITFESAIIATGSQPISLPEFSFDADPIWDSRQALAADQTPPRLLVVGAGYIGMELSTVFSRLGSDVTIVEMLDKPLPQYDDDLTQPVYERAMDRNIDFNFGEAASEWRRDGNDIIVTTETESGDTATYEVDRVLVAIGRKPVTDGLGLDAVSVETGENGFIEGNERGRTSSEHIFAIGDVAGEPMLAHAGMYEGIVAAETLAGQSPPSTREVPAVVFTKPEIATVGLTPDQAEERGTDPIVGKFPFSASGRAMTTRETSGFVRLVANQDGRLLGGQIVGPDASELIAEITLAVQTGRSLEELTETIHTHPTLSEATMEAAEHALGQAIHTTNR